MADPIYFSDQLGPASEDSELSDAESVGSIPPWSISDSRMEELESEELRLFLAKWRRHCVDFDDEEIREHYAEMSEEERLARWAGVRQLAKEGSHLATAGILTSTVQMVVSNWRRLLLHHEESTQPRLHRAVKVARTPKSKTSLAHAVDPSVMASTQALEDHIRELGEKAGKEPGQEIDWDELRDAKGLMELCYVVQDAYPDVTAETVKLLATAHGDKVLAAPIFNTSQTRRRTTAAPKKSAAPTQPTIDSDEESVQESGRQRKTLQGDARKDRFPPLDENLDEDYPMEERLTVMEILEIGRTITAGDPRKKGEFVANAGYRRHRAAPYAYTYYGALRRCYYGFVKMKYERGDKIGERIWPDALITKLCEGYNSYHEEHPNVVNAAGSLYRRLPPFIRPVRDKFGKYRRRKDTEAPVLTHFGKTNALAAAIKDEHNLVNIKAFEAKDVGLRRITGKDEATLAPILKATVEQERYLGLQKEMIPLMRAQMDKEMSAERAEMAQDRLSLEQRIEALEQDTENMMNEVMYLETQSLDQAQEIAALRRKLKESEEARRHVGDMFKRAVSESMAKSPATASQEVRARRLSEGEGERRKKKYT